MPKYLDMDIEYFRDIVSLCDESPSGICWNKDIRGGKNHSTIFYRKGDYAGSKRILRNKNGSVRHSSWNVKINKQHYACHRLVYLLSHGSIDASMMIDHIDGNALNNSIENLRLASSSINSRNTKKYNTNKTGISGVCLCFCKRDELYFYVATWRDCNGKPKGKRFSVNKYGEDMAIALAKAYRDKMIAEHGNYTDRHGKE